MELKSMRELDTIRGKMLVGQASQSEVEDFLTYTTSLEGLVDEASMEEFYGTEGWQHKLGIE